jgi:hypothetical protein
MEPMLAVTAVVTGVGSLVGLLFAAQVRAREIADDNREAVRRSFGA